MALQASSLAELLRYAQAHASTFDEGTFGVLFKLCAYRFAQVTQL
jgi:hypothetical protein